MALECEVERTGPLPVVFRALEAAACRVKDGWLEWVRVCATTRPAQARKRDLRAVADHTDEGDVSVKLWSLRVTDNLSDDPCPTGLMKGWCLTSTAGGDTSHNPPTRARSDCAKAFSCCRLASRLSPRDSRRRQPTVAAADEPAAHFSFLISMPCFESTERASHHAALSESPSWSEPSP